MEQDIYGYSLCAALTLMIFFGAYFIFSGEPDKPVFRNYIRSRRIMGAALLVLSANYMVHLLLRPRFTAPDAAILMNLSSYYISAWLFSSALTSLLDNHYLTRRKFTLIEHRRHNCPYIMVSHICFQPCQQTDTEIQESGQAVRRDTVG